MALIIDTQSGTCFSASSAVYLDDEDYNDEEWDAIADNDTEISELGILKGIPVMKSERLLRNIVYILAQCPNENRTEEENALNIVHNITKTIMHLRPDLIEIIEDSEE